MMKKLRAALVVATTWATTWGLWGALVTGVAFLLAPAYPGPVWPIILISAVRSGVFGFLGGALFSTLLGLRYGQYRLEDLRAGRLGVWGAVAGVLIPVSVTVAALVAIGFPITLASIADTVWAYGVPGLVTSYGTIKIAQSAVPELDTGHTPDALASVE